MRTRSSNPKTIKVPFTFSEVLRVVRDACLDIGCSVGEDFEQYVHSKMFNATCGNRNTKPLADGITLGTLRRWARDYDMQRSVST